MVRFSGLSRFAGLSSPQSRRGVGLRILGKLRVPLHGGYEGSKNVSVRLLGASSVLPGSSSPVSEEGSDQRTDPASQADSPRRCTRRDPRVPEAPSRSQRRRGRDGAGHSGDQNRPSSCQSMGEEGSRTTPERPPTETAPRSQLQPTVPALVGRDHQRKRIPCPRSSTQHFCRCSR